jgi:hypothetical protein
MQRLKQSPTVLGARIEIFLLNSVPIFILSILLAFPFAGCSEGGKLKDGGLRIGWAMEDITPDGPVSMLGQYYKRVSTYGQSPLKVTACAIESSNEKGDKEQAIMVSVDVCTISKAMQDSVKNRIKSQIPDFNSRKLFLNAIHTHSAPNPGFDWDVDSKPEPKYINLMTDRITKASVTAWKNRKPAGISRELGYAVVGHNRRVQYVNGTTEMYRSTDTKEFKGLEGPSDPGVEMLFCWDLNKELTGIIMNVSCPAQVTESKYYISSDYWGEVRRQVKDRFSKDIFILEQIGAAGDVSPRDLPRDYKSGEPDMWDVPGIIEIGRRLTAVVDFAYIDAQKTIQTTPVFMHTVQDINLPTRPVSKEEFEKSLKIVNEILSREPKDPNSPNTAWNRFNKQIEENLKTKTHGCWDDKETDFGILKINQVLLNNYENQPKNPFCPIELHVIRLGDVAFANNPFELYVDYGFRIKGQSKAKQTFLIQLSGDSRGYLPTQRGCDGGGYSGMVSEVGPVGGQMLVDTTVSLINQMWENQ